MGTTALRQLLKSLCTNSLWKYAVFWKLRPQNPMILTWEDGYCDYLKPREDLDILHDIYFNGAQEMFSSNCDTSTRDNSCSDYPIDLAMEHMSHLQYVFAEGIIGEVAYTGNHCWVLCDNICAGKFTTKVVPECPDEWRLQFAYGIKTILLVPAFPNGVLQLGSLETIAEDVTVVEYLKDRFNALQNAAGGTLPVTTIRDGQVRASSNPLSTSNRLIFTLQDEDRVSVEDPLEILNSEVAVLPVDIIEASALSNYSVNGTLPDIGENELFRLSFLEELLQACSQVNNCDVGVFGESSICTMHSYCNRDMRALEFGEMDVNDTGPNNLSSFFSFPMNTELHQVRGPDLGRISNFADVVEDTSSNSSLIRRRNLIDRTESSWSGKDADAEYLLEAVVSNAYRGSDGISCKRSNSVMSSTISSGQFAASSQAQGQADASAHFGGNLVSGNRVTTVFSNRSTGAFTSSSASDSPKSMMSSLIHEEKSKRGYGNQQLRKGAKLSNVSRRRAKTGDNQKLRPRDRQMIQDRVKELRELVPNGAKCSIDGLLDKTIKHMRFLRTVTDQAEKLKQGSNQEITSQKSQGSSESNDGSQNGRSWAVEFKSEHQECPIVVEDHKYPGHMLIEMICNDHGLFLEIAQVLRDLNLTILKGTIKSHSNNTWAHFIVEASKGFNRMEIFWPLMQLLQHKRNPISTNT